jgi:hypothetical protein
MRQPRFADGDQVPFLTDRFDVLGARAVDKRREPLLIKLCFSVGRPRILRETVSFVAE